MTAAYERVANLQAAKTHLWHPVRPLGWSRHLPMMLMVSWCFGKGFEPRDHPPFEAFPRTRHGSCPHLKPRVAATPARRGRGGSPGLWLDGACTRKKSSAWHGVCPGGDVDRQQRSHSRFAERMIADAGQCIGELRFLPWAKPRGRSLRSVVRPARFPHRGEREKALRAPDLGIDRARTWIAG